MKRLRAIFHSWESRIEDRWHKLSAKKQRKFVVLFFAGYLLVTGCVIITVWYDARMDAKLKRYELDHIRNPTLQNRKQQGDSSLKNEKKSRLWRNIITIEDR
jgi:hypothetical protein